VAAHREGAPESGARAARGLPRARGPRPSARPGVVNAMVVVIVMPMMRRVGQRDVCEKNQRDREANNLTHDSIPNPE